MQLSENLALFTLWGLSILIFPTSLAFIMVLFENKSWCFSDECLEGKGVHRTPVRILAGIFYGYLLLTAFVALAAKRVERLRRVLERSIASESSVTIAEMAWFIGLLLLVFPIFLGSVWDIYWASEISKMQRAASQGGTQKPWVNYFYEAVTYISGDMCAVVIGFVLIPTSKNSVIAHYLRLPYTATVRMHRWLGWTIAATCVLHTVFSMLWKALDSTPLYQLFFTLAPNTPWGKERYRYITGWAAMFFLAIVIITALPWVRRNAYNTFIWSHLLGIPFVAFAYFHNSIDIYFAIP
ncbi:ferric/cupric-chelate reductase, partial [Gonapodya sp. JEL0774]